MKIAATCVSIVLAGIVVSGLAAQTPTAQEKPSGLIMGVVVDALNDRPVRSALVSLGAERVLTDAEGRFVFTDLRKNNYRVRATKPGYFEGSYGRSRAYGPEREIALGTDERLADVKIAIWKHAAITGVVVDQNSDPMADVQIRLFSRTARAGKPVLVFVGETKTDDRGAYRIGRLSAANYVLATLAYPLPPTERGSFVYPAEYFGATAIASEATVISLRLGEERTGIDGTLRLVKGLQVSGILRSSTGPVVSRMTLVSNAGESAAVPALESAVVTSDSTGRFVFPAVTPGAYTIRVEVPPAPTQVGPISSAPRLQWAAVPVVVDAVDVRNVDVLLQNGLRVSGLVEFDVKPGARTPADVRTIRGMIEPASGLVDGSVLPEPFAVNYAGRFTTGDVPPGRYAIHLDNLPAGFSIARMTAYGRDIANAALPVTRDVNFVVITLTDRASELTGVVQASPAGTHSTSAVMSFPADPAAWEVGGRVESSTRSVLAGRDGAYRLVGLPDGDYFLVAVDDAKSAELEESGTFELLARISTRVTLAAGDKKNQDLKTTTVIR